MRLTGAASVNDLLVTTERDDRTARADAPTRYEPAADGPVIGRVLAAAGDREVAIVGLDEAAALRGVVARQQSELKNLKHHLNGLTGDRDRHQAHIDALMQQVGADRNRLAAHRDLRTSAKC